MNKLIPFDFDGRQLRAVKDAAGEPWFVAADVCAMLTIGNSRDTMARLDAEDKGVGSIDTPSGTQKMSIVNESGLYALILGSRKPEAKAFKRWVTADVLPTIRKTGSFSLASTALPDFTDPAAAARAWADEYQAKQALAIENAAQAQQIVEAAPKVDFAEAVMNTDDTWLVRDVAKMIGAPVMKLYALLKAKGVILNDNAPAATYTTKGYFKEAMTEIKPKADGTQRFRSTARVTGRGVEFLRRFVKRHAVALNMPVPVAVIPVAKQPAVLASAVRRSANDSTVKPARRRAAGN